MKSQIILIMAFVLLMGSPAIAGERGHDQKEAGHAHEKHGDHEEGGAIKLTPAQIKQAGIETEILKLRPRIQTINGPGSVTFNTYKLADVTTLVDGVVHARHVRLGDKVKKRQKLVTLISSALARAEADYLRSEAEHRKSKLDLKRLDGLAKEKIISQARLQQAISIHQAAHANLAASRAALASYGLSRGKIDSLINLSQYGQLTLYAPGSGTIVADDFRIGQHVAAGALLMRIADERTVWVEAKVPESQLSQIKPGQKARIRSKSQSKVFYGYVANIHRQLDPVTRTGGVRLEVGNSNDALQPGMFVEASIAVGNGEPVLLVPEKAIQRQGSELIVFVEEEPGKYERREVKTGKASMGLVPILDGVKEGDSVVINGAFILASELAKAGFEAHNH
ncbi:MAG: efflux RND transporter periplasmic adaptor subunit [Zetaproteobacteria bacterium]|nr:MAG: efflux RND transporter periplasmic adaptor subunit [Zetaproteobacteria bacterium]